ncbi:hypothetical protein BH11PSE12_BH11PSE12_28130 [soil metagenome]
MSYPGFPYLTLHQYLSRLHLADCATGTLWLDEQGRARGRYVNATLTSVFQAIRAGDGGRVSGYDAYARSYAGNEDSDQGLTIWRLLDLAASDDESVSLDRLCRLLHTINFFRQGATAGSDLYLNVHSRLLTAVAGDHGRAFRRILDALELPAQPIVLQLPLINASQRWVLAHVAENYRRNGFRIALLARHLAEAGDLLERVRPDAIKLDVRLANDAPAQIRLLEQAYRQHCKIIFTRLEDEQQLQALQTGLDTSRSYFVQGFLFDQPKAGLASNQDDASNESKNVAPRQTAISNWEQRRSNNFSA